MTNKIVDDQPSTSSNVSTFGSIDLTKQSDIEILCDPLQNSFKTFLYKKPISQVKKLEKQLHAEMYQLFWVEKIQSLQQKVKYYNICYCECKIKS